MIGILGVPFDYGTELIGGRAGSRLAPPMIMHSLLERYHGLNNMIGFENIKPIKNDSIKTHEIIYDKTLEMFREYDKIIVIGGSHDISWGSIKALYETYKTIGGMNFDAHYDVREVIDGKITSGTPFRRVLDDKLMRGMNFVELGMQAKSNSSAHRKYLLDNHATIIHLDKIKDIKKTMKKSLAIASKNTKAIFLDIDIDGIDGKYAPGCSAPAKTGFSQEQMIKAAYIAGKNPYVKLFNLTEVNPIHDDMNKTVDLAADIISSFIGDMQ